MLYVTRLQLLELGRLLHEGPGTISVVMLMAEGAWSSAVIESAESWRPRSVTLHFLQLHDQVAVVAKDFPLTADHGISKREEIHELTFCNNGILLQYHGQI